MPGWNGSGSFTVTHDFTEDAAADIDPAASRFDQNFTDVKSGLENCMTRDGQTAATAPISMGSFKITNLAAGVASTDAANVGQISAETLQIHLINQVFS